VDKSFEPISPDTESVAAVVVDAALQVHRRLGPGLLENVYEACLCHELAKRDVNFERQFACPVTYDGIRLETGLRLDLVVEGCVVVELKAVEHMNSLFEAQVLTYLKLSGKRVGLLINFNVPLLKDGIKRFVR
jgi:GxxExxY protein